MMLKVVGCTFALTVDIVIFVTVLSASPVRRYTLMNIQHAA